MTKITVRIKILNAKHTKYKAKRHYLKFIENFIELPNSVENPLGRTKSKLKGFSTLFLHLILLHFSVIDFHINLSKLKKEIFHLSFSNIITSVALEISTKE
ncbi:hypothetical protein [Mycoplasma testudineum]|nr:hypothetical protein [Mycoplasma testudineum]